MTSTLLKIEITSQFDEDEKIIEKLMAVSSITGKFPEGEIQPHGLTKNIPIGFCKRVSEEEKR